ncbi:hypothetical protein TcYC6_0052910 [Trypanosoma cruzi]|uniref:Uncharacterized protein n=1 Tax=Trypanosoma cruzi (strain CL Brener) TaxID=353153 RepID=Q4D3H4_TRYCC|nr:hypothetical protein Tc00.1047053507511.60 [Trypanosoma cruzi]EAN87079.1 hypothetical protein Tc00.1047053507511.60 [Trypanosoma cruzi]KAF8301798.1 hypothetical protein TcYC6_0052910 [Trypanosoma cruzi]RNC60499.1 hypothetical protein TcCL_ESM01846 [Trypanosoma cruzi]|eukprot:XP_808930.1 hypothetical protein [Trypanosoma cruzi strain CL Brener]
MNCTSLRHSVAAITAPRNPESIRASLKRKKHTTVWSNCAAPEGRQLALQRPYECAWAQLKAKILKCSSDAHAQFQAVRIRLAPMQRSLMALNGTTTWRPSALSQARHKSPPLLPREEGMRPILQRQSEDPTNS